MQIQSDMTNEDFCELMTNHSERLGIIQGCFSLFLRCAKDNIFNCSKSEIWSFGVILEEYIKNTKEEFMNFADDMNALR